jgi:protein transport protein SEC61 subunit alpha
LHLFFRDPAYTYTSVFALITPLGQATIYIVSGLYGQPSDLGASVCLLIIQLIVAILIDILLDDFRKATV